jgi:hypothetical protein
MTMTCRWRIVFDLVDGLPIREGAAEYPHLGATLNVPRQGQGRIEVSADVDGTSSEQQVIRLARSQASLVFEVLKFRSHLPDVIESVRAFRLNADGVETNATFQDATLHATGVVADWVSVPSETDFYGRDRLHAWLKWWNDAKASGSDSDFLRTCYVICEDMEASGVSVKADPRFAGLRAARNFVCHGGNLRDPSVLSFLQSHLGLGHMRFDPLDSNHVAFVNGQRHVAEGFVQGLIAQRMA